MNTPACKPLWQILGEQDIKLEPGSTVLDLGCGFPFDLLSLYNKGFSQNLSGIDISEAAEDFEMLYKRFLKDFGLKTNTWPPAIRLHYQTAIKDYLTKNIHPKHSLIILSDVLHQQPAGEAEWIVNNLTDHLRGEGIIYYKGVNRQKILRLFDSFGCIYKEECGLLVSALFRQH
ncbi:MAG: hypothetical protein M3Q97_07755 [Bacteroidota bacterium]|nr:hypothetical protein [Bacteroidota bacterium]